MTILDFKGQGIYVADQQRLQSAVTSPFGDAPGERVEIDFNLD